MFNEVFIFITIYFTFIFTNFVQDAKVKYDIGWIFTGFIIAGLFMNFVVIGLDIYYQVKKKRGQKRYNKAL